MTKLFGLRRPGLAIFALAAFAFAALAAWRGYALYQERAQHLALGRASVAGVALYIGNYIARTVDAADLLAEDTREYVAAQGGVSAADPAALHRRLAQRARSTSIEDYILVVNPSGRAIAYSESPQPPVLGFADREWFRAAAAGRTDSYVGPAIRSRLTGKVVYTYSEPIRGPDGALQGVVAVGITPNQPKPTSARAPGEQIVQLWTSDRRLIVAAHMDFDAEGNPAPQVPPFATPPKAPMGFLSAGPDDLIGYRVADGRPLVATARLSSTELLARWRRSVRDSVVLLLVSGLVIAVLSAFAARFAGQDYRARLQLERTARELSGALAEKDRLLREIHHRVKNNLQITSSLIQLQARSFTDPEVREAFQQTQQRLRSISLVHDVLYHESTSARGNLAVYLDELAQELATANGAAERGVAITVDADPVTLSPGQVTPLGLAVAEVVTNSFKHAFPGGRSGSIRVTARDRGEEIEVVVRDDGRGFDPAGVRKGSLGLLLVNVLTGQLGGRSGFGADGGSVFTLAFPKKA